MGTPLRTCCHDKGTREGVRAAHTGCACAPGKGPVSSPWIPPQQNGRFGELPGPARSADPASATPRDRHKPAIAGLPLEASPHRQDPAILRWRSTRAFHQEAPRKRSGRSPERAAGSPGTEPGTSRPPPRATRRPTHPPGAPAHTLRPLEPCPSTHSPGGVRHLPDRFAARGDWGGGLPQPAESSAAGRPTQKSWKRFRAGRARAHGRAHGHTPGARRSCSARPGDRRVTPRAAPPPYPWTHPVRGR